MQNLHSLPTRRSSDLLRMIEDLTYRRTGGGERVAERHRYVGWQIDRKRKAIVSMLRNVVFEEIRVEEGERSEEHTSELQSPCNLVCRLLLEKKKNKQQ